MGRSNAGRDARPVTAALSSTRSASRAPRRYLGRQSARGRAGRGTRRCDAGARLGSSTCYSPRMSPRRSNPAAALPAAGLRARVLPQVDRTQRLAAMLDRWDAEDIADEPDWDVSDLEPLAMRPPSDP